MSPRVKEWLATAVGSSAAMTIPKRGNFGVDVSGAKTSGGLLKGAMTGPDWLSGGSFGPEASIVAVVLSVALGVASLIAVSRREHFVPTNR